METAKKTPMTELGYKIFLDRYALKDLSRESLKVGDTVVAVVTEGKNSRSEIGTVQSLEGDYVSVKLLDGSCIRRLNDQVDKPLELQPEDMWRRVAKGAAQAEKPELREKVEDQFYHILEDFKFVPGGRISAMCGSGHDLTAYNCFVLPSPHDSREGIVRDSAMDWVNTQSMGGGVGINLSTLRPKNSFVRKVNGRSSGSVSWAELFSFLTNVTNQGGCFSLDQRLHTSAGLVPAEELFWRVRKGEHIEAYTHEGKRKITAAFDNGSKEVVEVVTKSGFKCKISRDHKVAILRGSEISTIPIYELSPGDEVLILLGEGSSDFYQPLLEEEEDLRFGSKPINLPLCMDEDLAWWLGYVYGNGYLMMDKAITVSIPDKYPEILERYAKVAKKVFNKEVITGEGCGACSSNKLYSRRLVRWMAKNGFSKSKASELTVPEVIYRSPSSVQSAFVSGYYDADGCDKGSKAGYAVTSISKLMLEGVQTILAANGIRSHISVDTNRNENWEDLYTLSVTSREFRERFWNWTNVTKFRHNPTQRDCVTYPISLWEGLKKEGVKNKFINGIFDPSSSRFSVGALRKVSERLEFGGEIALAEKCKMFLNLTLDSILSITFLGLQPVVDFEVEETHLLSAGGVYSSNSRRGAAMLILEDWHPDIEDFIDSKRESGRINYANISVGISDKFMDAVENDSDWDLYFPDTSAKAYDTEWDGDIENWIAYGYPIVHYKTVKARYLWDKIVNSAWASAEPGLWFRDRSNSMSNSYYYGEGRLICTNPCQPGFAKVATPEGIRCFDDIEVGSTIWSGDSWTKVVRKVCTGTKPVFAFRTRAGTFYGTENHNIFSGGVKIQVGDAETIDVCEVLSGSDGEIDPTDVLDGLMLGDGTAKRFKEERSFKYDRTLLCVGAEDTSYFDSEVGSLIGRNYGSNLESGKEYREVQTTLTLDELPKTYDRDVPDRFRYGSSTKVRGFLRGLYSANGSIVANRITLKASSFSVIESVQEMLSFLGINSYYTINKPKTVKFSNGDYACRQSYDLNIGYLEGRYRFASLIGFIHPEKTSLLLKTLDCKPSSRKISYEITEVDYLGDMPVYSITVDDSKHSYWTSGLLVANCGEQPLPAWSVCNLGHINLSKFVGETGIDWNLLAGTVRSAVRFLDNVIDITNYPHSNNEKQQKCERRVGLGTLGLAEMLIRLKIRYGSSECVDFLGKLYSFIAIRAYEASIELAMEKKPFPFYSREFLDSGFVRRLPSSLQDRIAKYGIRNVTLLTQAPVGTGATMVNTSSGIEPFFYWSYIRKGKLGSHEERVRVFDEWAKESGWSEGDPLPEYFATAMDLTPEEHVNVQATIQLWTDSAISKTVNTPSTYTVEETKKLYELMHRMGCKGGTIYRDKSRDEQVLNLKEDAKQEDLLQGRPKFRPKLKRRTGTTISKSTSGGTAHVTMTDDETGNPLEVFIDIGKGGSDVKAMAEMGGRLISLALRMASLVDPKDVVKEVVEQLENIGGRDSVGFGPNMVRSLPDAIAKALKEVYLEDSSEDSECESEGFKKGDICPSCGDHGLVEQSGCRSCFLCGFAMCG